MDLNIILVPLAALLVFLFFFLLIWFFIETLKSKGMIARSLNMSLFLISLPRGKKEEGKSEKEMISVMEQLYASFGNLQEKGLKTFFYGQPHLVFEMAVSQVGREIKFYLSVPRCHSSAIEKLIHGIYPEAQIEGVKDYNIFNPTGAAAGAYLKLSQSYVLPIKTYKNLEADPLRQISNALSKIAEEGEGAVLQVLIRPTTHDWRKLSLDIIKEMRQGQSFTAAFKKVLRPSAAKFLITASEGQKKEEAPSQIKQPAQEDIIKFMEEKAGKNAFETNIRMLASAASQERAEQILSGLENAFAQFMAVGLNNFKPARLKGGALNKLIFNFAFRNFNSAETLLLNTEELTSLYHLPVVGLDASSVKFLEAKIAPAPLNLLKEGIILGKNVFRGEEAMVHFGRDDRRRHLYVIGQTGTGKSVLLQNMIKQDIENGEGLAVIDPHDLAESILDLIPKNRLEDVIWCDPADMERSFGLNMLEYDSSHPEQKSFIVNEMLAIFHKLFGATPESLGPVFEQYTRNSLQLLMDDPNEPATLLDVPRVLVEADYRRYLLEKCKNIVVKDFWEKEAEKVGGEASIANIAPYITSKFNIFIANDYMRPIIGQSKSSFNFREILDGRKILLVNASKGKLGDINMALLGLLFVGKILMAAFSRADLSVEKRQDFYLYIDEFQNFATETIGTILAEARKYRLNLITANQFIDQLPEQIKNAVLGNVGSKITFRVGVKDAPIMVKEFEPVFNESDLLNIANRNAYVKLLVDGEVSRPFNIQTFAPGVGNPVLAQKIKEYSRLKYGRPREEIEREIIEQRKI